MRSSRARNILITTILLFCRTLISLGEYDVGTDQDCEQVKCSDPIQQRKPSKVIQHEMYNSETFENDLAIVVLDQDALLSDCEY